MNALHPIPHKAEIERTATFWDRNPCDGHSDDILARMHFKHTKEPWLPEVLDEAACFENILEIGCGQGTDAFYCAQKMKPGGAYTGIDLSENSLSHARNGCQRLQHRLSVIPEFKIGNAEALAFDNEMFDCVISLGVLHHTPNTQQALSEIYRVLKPGGLAVVMLYRRFSPKLLGAYTIRFLAHVIDKMTFSQHGLLRIFQRVGADHFWGTMLLECVGVPILKSYTKSEVKQQFSGEFESIHIRSVGVGFHLWGLNSQLRIVNDFFGAHYIINAQKRLD